jgi:hypothetical protein
MVEFDALISQCEAKRETLRQEMDAVIELRESAVKNFFSAAEQGNVPECARFLDEVLGDVHVKKSRRKTALSFAVCADQLDTVSFLHSRGAFEGVDEFLLCDASSRPMLELLERFGMKPSSYTLSSAIEDKNYAIVEYLASQSKLPLLGVLQRGLGEPDLGMIRLLLAHHVFLGAMSVVCRVHTSRSQHCSDNVVAGARWSD